MNPNTRLSTHEKVFSGHQPNFLPYMGFFYKMFQSDMFVLDDDVQYSRDGYHNTNYIRVNGQKHKITVPVTYTFGDPINKVKICYERDWDKKLLKTIQMNYGKAPYFDDGYDFLKRHFEPRYEYLADLNIIMIREIAARMNLGCRIYVASKDVPCDFKNQKRNVYQCTMLGGDIYYSGVGGKAYNDENDWFKNGIALEYSDYVPVQYRQTGYGFIENLSVIDYIFNKGFNMPEGWVRIHA